MKRLRAVGGKVTVKTSGNTFVLPTDDSRILQDFNEYILNSVRRIVAPSTTYNFEDSYNISTGLQNITRPWIVLIDCPRTDIIIDTSGNPINGTMANVSIASDNIGNPYGAVKLNGTGSSINCGNRSAYNVTSTMTAVFWLKVLSTPTTYPRIMSKELATGGDSFGIYVHGTRLGMTTHSIVDVAASATDSIGSDWIRAVFTFSKPDAMFYVNGERSGNTGTYNADLAVTAYDLILGNNSANSRYSDMILKDVRLYNRVWSQEEVTADAAGQQVSSAGLVGQWNPYQPSNEIDFFLHTHRPKNVQFVTDETGIIRSLTLYPGNGLIYHGRITHSNVILDTDSDLKPDCLDPIMSGSVSNFLQSLSSVDGTPGVKITLLSTGNEIETSNGLAVFVRGSR